MASPDDATPQGASERPSSSEESISSTTPHYQHPFPFTIVPNCFIDEYVPRLSATAQSLMLVLYRLTLGWHRADTFTSLNELRQRTGIASHATLNGALKELLAAGLITLSQKRGLRGLKGYCLTPTALSATASVEVPLQNLTQYLYRNRNSTSTESVEVISSQLAQGVARDKPKERLKKTKETTKENVRYVRSQNETEEKSEEHTNMLSPAAFLTRLLEQRATLHVSGTAASSHMDGSLDTHQHLRLFSRAVHRRRSLPH